MKIINCKASRHIRNLEYLIFKLEKQKERIKLTLAINNHSKHMTGKAAPELPDLPWWTEEEMQAVDDLIRSTRDYDHGSYQYDGY